MIHVYEIEQLGELRETARSVLVQKIHDTDKPMVSPFLKQDADRLVAHTVIRGLAVYDMDYTMIKAYGAALMLRPSIKGRNPGSYRSDDGFRYEVMFTSREIGHPYNIAARLDSTDVSLRIASNTLQALGKVLLLSTALTAIFMRALHQLLLAPILRRNDEIMRRVYAQNEDKMRKLAYFDGLTGLPNRTYFLEFLKESIKQKTHGKDGVLAVLFIDLDYFKDINDAMGYEAGDRLLETIAQRLVRSLPDNAVIARFNADEFAVLVSLQPGQPDSSALVEKILFCMNEPVEIVQETFLVRASIGVSHYPHDGKEAYDILKNADIALNRAKAEGRAAVRYYSRDFDLMVQQRVQMLHDLRKAMEQKQLQLYYQPQFDLKTGHIVGVEALLRWWRPDNSKEGGKFISPTECIPVAEQSGLIVPIGEYVLRTACATAKMWQDKGLPPIRMAVNISGIQFHRSDIVSLVADVLKETKLEPRWLELELTESIFIKDTQGAINILDMLHRLGVETAIDDFGTGYSSLSYLCRFPIDRLKIDQSFIWAAPLHHNDRMIIRGIINLGHSLNLKVIAEGVETKEHEDLLKEEGCNEVQGFKYSKAIPAEEFWDFAVAHMKRPAKNEETRLLRI